MKAWSEQNEITYIDNEPIFEFRNVDVDVDSYVMHGEMPALHGSTKTEESGDVTTVGRETTEWTNADTLRS